LGLHGYAACLLCSLKRGQAEQPSLFLGFCDSTLLSLFGNTFGFCFTPGAFSLLRLFLYELLGAGFQLAAQH
jgi:hypothetical protein